MMTRRTPYPQRAPYAGRGPYWGVGVRIAAVLLIIWFAIGAVAALQRHYFSNGAQNCAKVGTTIVTVLAGPLNYVGANPQVHNCQTPQPSK